MEQSVEGVYLYSLGFQFNMIINGSLYSMQLHVHVCSDLVKSDEVTAHDYHNLSALMPSALPLVT